MADARRLDTALVGRALALPATRAYAVLTLGQVLGARGVAAFPGAGPAAAARLRGLVADPDTTVAATAAYALGLLRDTAGVPALAGRLRGPSTVASEAAWSLGEVGEPARSAIEGALGGGGADPRVAPALLLAASKLRPVPVRVVTPYLRSGAEPVAEAAAYAIARPRVAGGLRALLPLAGSPHASVRAQVARALAAGPAGDSLAVEARAALSVLAADPSPHVRINAIRSYATFGAPAADALGRALRDVDPNVRIAAAQVLDPALGTGEAAWLDAWRADTALAFRRSVLEGAARAGLVLAPLRAGAADGWASAADWGYRAAAVQAAAGGRSVEDVRRIALPLVRDQDPRVRAAAWRAVAQWADSAGPDRRAWRSLLVETGLREPDPYARAAVLGALTRGARATDLPAVLRAYAASRGDSTNDARLAAVRWLVAVWRADSAAVPDSLRAALRALPAPADPLERAEGRRLALLAGWPDAGGTSRPLAWYENVVRAVLLPSRDGRRPRADVVTDRGTISLELYGADAPLTVHNFLELARAGLYRDTRFHRVVPNFVAQDGDPRGDGEGGPGYAIRDEHNRRRYDRGAVGMALSGPDTGGSQYFITHSPQPHLDGHYTVFGHVVAGHDVLDRIVQGDRISEVRIR